MRCRRRGEPKSWKGAGNMLKLPPQFELCLKATGTTSQLSDAETAAGRGRSGYHVTLCRSSGVQVGRISSSKELFVEAGAANWMVVHHSWRVKRSFSSGRCKLWLNQIRGTVRDASPPGLLLVPVSYTTTPALERNDRYLSPSSKEDNERFLNALVASAPLMVSNDTNNGLIRNVDHEEEVGRAAGNHREEPRKEAKKVNAGKQKWRLCSEGLQISPEMQQKRIDWASQSDHLRQLEEKFLLLESVDVDTAKVMALCPSVANSSIEKLKSVIDFLESCGMRRKDLGRILSMTPQILGLGVENHLRPAVRFLLKEIGLPKTNLRKVINRCPRLLVASVDSQLRPTMHFLEGLGFNSMASLVSNNATLLTFGIQSKLLPKLEFIQTLGMSRDEAVTLVLRFPAIFSYGVEQNLQPKYDYLVNVMGRDVDSVKAFPQYFGYSLDYRIRPRYEFLHQRNLRVSLPNFLKFSDDEFYRRFKGVQVRRVGEEQNLAAVIEPQVGEAGEKPKIAAVIGSRVDEVGEKSKVAGVKESEAAADHTRVPAHIGV